MKQTSSTIPTDSKKPVKNPRKRRRSKLSHVRETGRRIYERLEVQEMPLPELVKALANERINLPTTLDVTITRLLTIDTNRLNEISAHTAIPVMVDLAFHCSDNEKIPELIAKIAEASPHSPEITEARFGLSEKLKSGHSRAPTAASLLGGFRNPEDVPVLAGALESSDSVLSNNAAYALRVIAEAHPGDPNFDVAITPLVRMLACYDYDKKSHAFHALVAIGERAIPELFAASLKRSDDSVTSPKEAIFQIGEDIAIPYMIKILQSPSTDENEQKQAVNLLRNMRHRMKKEQVSAIIRMVLAGNPHVACVLDEKKPEPEAVSALIQVMHGREYSFEARKRATMHLAYMLLHCPKDAESLDGFLSHFGKMPQEKDKSKPSSD